MPPKFDPKSPEVQELISLFGKVGLSEKAATELVRQPKSAAPFKALVEDFGLAKESHDEKVASNLVKLSASCGKLGQGEKAYAVERILKGDLKTADQVAGALASFRCQVPLTSQRP
jgi:glutaminyl-tRNA synthetase